MQQSHNAARANGKVAKSFKQIFEEAAANDDNPLDFDREEAFHDWYYGEIAKLERGEEAQVRRWVAEPRPPSTKMSFLQLFNELEKWGRGKQDAASPIQMRVPTHLRPAGKGSIDVFELLTPQWVPPAAEANKPERNGQAANGPSTGDTASVPFMITAAQKQQLADLGYSEAAIFEMKPGEAQEILAGATKANGEEAQKSTDNAAPQTSPNYEVLLDYLQLGWTLMRLPPRSKEPYNESHDAATITRDNAKSVKANENIAVRFTTAGALKDLDLDYQSAVDLAKAVGLTEATAAFGRSSVGVGHLFYSSPGAEAKKFKLPEGKYPRQLPIHDGKQSLLVLEIRGADNTYTMVPPSVHPCGDTLAWKNNTRQPTKVEPAELRKLAGRHAFASAVLYFYPENATTRYETRLALAGALLRSGMALKDAELYARAVARLGGDEKWKEDFIDNAEKRINQDKPAPGLPKLIEALQLPEACKTVFHEWLQGGELSEGLTWRDTNTDVKQVPAVIAHWNKDHAHVLAGSKSCVLQEFRTPENFIDFKLLTSAAFKEWNAEFNIAIGKDKDGNPIEIAVSKYWLAHPKRRKYQDIGFFPQRDVPRFYNLWRGFTVEPRQGGCSKFLAHLHDNICQGDEELFAWVEAWFADIFQRPGVKCGTSLAMRGKQGVGKTKVGEVFESLLGVHYKLVSDPRYVTGRFNSHMISLLLLFADEGFWAGDKKAEGKLKDLVTGKNHPIEFKGKEAFWIDNYVRLLVSGNEDWVVPAGFEERRFATLDVGEEHRNDYPYFAAIDKEMNEGGREALLYHLLFEVDCSKVNLRQIPHTAALVDQKLQSVTTEQGWWLDILRNGILPGDWEGTGAAPSELLFDSYIEHAKKKGVARRAIETQVGMFLNKMVGEENLQRKKQTWWMPEPSNNNSTRQQRRSLVYQFPTLSFCRDRFTKLFEEEMKWDEEGDWTADGDVGEEAPEPQTTINFSPGHLLLVKEFLLGWFKQAGKKCLPKIDIMEAGKARNICQQALEVVAMELGIEQKEGGWVLPQRSKAPTGAATKPIRGRYY